MVRFRSLFALIFLGLISISIFAQSTKRNSAVPVITQTVAIKNAERNEDTLAFYEKTLKNIKPTLTPPIKLSINTLSLLRIKLSMIQKNLEVMQKKYQLQLKNIESVLNEFSKLKETKIEKKYQVEDGYTQFFDKKIKGFVSTLNKTQARLLQIHLILYDTNQAIRAVNTQLEKLHNGGTWKASNAFYKLDTWRLAFSGFYIYGKRLFDQGIETGRHIIANIAKLQFWLVLLAFVALLLAYIKILWKKTINYNFVKRQHAALFHFINRGLLPVAFCLVFQKILPVILFPSPPLMMYGLLCSILNTMAFIFILNASITILSHYRSSFFIQFFKSVIYAFAIVLFTNNINFYSLDAFGYPFFSSAAIALVNLLISLYIVIAFVSLKQHSEREK